MTAHLKPYLLGLLFPSNRGVSNVDSIWERVGNKALELAESVLDRETAPTAATVETVKGLVEIAVMIDSQNLLWAQNPQYAELPFRSIKLKLNGEEIAKEIKKTLNYPDLTAP